MNTFIFKTSKPTKLFFKVFLGAGVAITTTALFYTLYFKIYSEIAISILFLSVIYLPFIAYLAFENRPKFIVDEKGIKAVNFGMILFAWEAIEKIQLVSVVGFKCIRVSVKKPKSFFAELPSAWKLMVLASKITLIRPYILNVSCLEYSPDEILELLQTELKSRERA